MMPHECPYEADVMDAIASMRWPDRCEPSLQAHVAGCDVCRDLALVAAPISHAFDEAIAVARVPSADAVWLRAQVRARADAERLAMRPVLVTAAVALACAIGLAAGAVTLGLPWLRATLADRLAAMEPRLPALPPLGQAMPDVAALVAGVAQWSPVHLVALGALLLAAPLALYAAGWEGTRRT
jgi:hypothetical protein